MARANIAISIVVISVVAVAPPSDRIAFGQGSVGGTLGKTDKSLSGNRETAAPSKDATRPNKNTAEAAGVSVAGRWKWTADCQSGHWVGAFTITQGVAGAFTGGFLHTNWADIGTISEGHVSSETLSFIRTWTMPMTLTQHWSGQLTGGGRHINGNITGNENCAWEGVKE
jgi:hypothetical protein